MIDEFAKSYLRDELDWARRSLLDTLDGLSEYEVRRPLTSTGTNLLGLVKHLTVTELVYLGDVFLRPAPQPHPRFDDPGFRNRDSLWAAALESRADVVSRYQAAWEYSDATIEVLAIDARGHVPWWPAPHVLMFNVMVHVLSETNRHAGHADILREELVGPPAAPGAADDWPAHRARVEEAARRAGATP